MRVSNSMLSDTTIRNLEVNSQRMDKLQDQLTSGKRIRYASDDPVAVTKSLSYRSTIADIDQHLRNVDQSQTWLNSTDNALGGITSLLSRARELAVQGGSDSAGADDRANIAAEINQILLQTIEIANTSVGGQSLFAGSKVTTPAFTADNSDYPTVITYNGDATKLSREVDFNSTITVNIPGDTAFSAVFTALQGLRDNLTAGDGGAIRNRVTELDACAQSVLSFRAEAGAKVNRLDSVAARMTDLSVSLTGLLSKEEDLDLADAITKFSVAESVYKASLAVGAKAIQPSLIEFLR